MSDRAPFEVGDLVIGPKGRYGRVVADCGSFVVITEGDPDRGHISVAPVVAVPDHMVEAA